MSAQKPDTKGAPDQGKGSGEAAKPAGNPDKGVGRTQVEPKPHSDTNKDKGLGR